MQRGTGTNRVIAEASLGDSYLSLFAVTLFAVVAPWLVGCGGPLPLPSITESPLVQPASTETPAFSARLGSILSLADIEVETRQIDFAALADASPLRGGWALEPELGQAWGTGAGSSLMFRVMPVRSLVLELRCAPFHFDGSERQRLTISVNGNELETIRLWKMMRGYSFQIPAEILQFGANRLDLSYEYSAVPEEVLPESEDKRHLAVLFEHFRFGRNWDTEVATPVASGDGTQLNLPFSSRVSYYLELGVDSSLRIGGVEPWTDGDVAPGPGWRLRLEAAVDGLDSTEIVELGPEQLRSPIEIRLPTTEAGQRVRVALASYSDRTPADPVRGLTLDLPEVVSHDEALAELLMRRGSEPPVGLPDAGTRPNILIYMIDTLRADHLGSYGYSRPTSPRIDAFAADATLFENVVAQSSWTKPSVASLLTGLNPSLHGVNQRKDALALEAVTMAEVLWEAGYDTAAIYTNGNLSHMGLGQGYAHYQHLREGTTRAIHVLSDELNEEAYRWLARRDRSKPFFLYLHASDPHSPYTPADGYLERLGLEVSDPDAGLIENVKGFKRNRVDERQLEDVIALYDAEIAFNDEHFGRLLDELERQGLLDSTLIVVVSDHGEEFFDHGWWQHGKTLFREQLAVPLIVSFPGGLGAGQVIDAMAQHIDLFPTILDIVGVESSLPLPGRSLLPLVTSGGWERPTYAISYLSLDNREAQSVTSPMGKLILHHYDGDRSRLLFDLATDPAEQDDLYTERPVLAGYLLSQLRAFDLAQQERLAPERGEPDAELMERLKALGYFE